MNDHVSRETPPAPDVAGEVFSLRLPLAHAYAQLLAGPGTERGLIGPREVPRLWERHLLNCAIVTDLIPEGRTVCDIGSGAGLPGMVLALRRSDLQVTLVEPLLRRTIFLTEAVHRLGLSNVEVFRGRADAVHGLRDFDVVTSRAVAPLDRLLEWSLPLVRQDGVMLAMKGTSVADELSGASTALRRLGGGEPEVITLGTDTLVFPTTVVRVQAGRPSRLRLSTAGGAVGRGSSRSQRKRY